jgi:hypothetical protein
MGNCSAAKDHYDRYLAEPPPDAPPAWLAQVKTFIEGCEPAN